MTHLEGMRLTVKICGIRTPDAIAAASEGGARAVGFVFYPKSPRAVSVELAATLARMVPTGMRAIGLFVDPDEEYLESIVSQVPLDVLQLHGAESPERVAEIRAAYGIPVMKAVRVATAADLEQVPPYEAVADMLLFDAKLPANVAALPGGNGVPFDWSILAGRRWDRPWMLSGGLNVDNLAEAVAETGARAVDVSSGVETRPGLKDPARIRSLLAVAADL